jgi:hypothetical protein
MNNNSQTKAAEQMIEAIFALDLEPIKMKLMDSKEGHGWSKAEADRHEIDYKRFLALMAKYPDDVIAPNINVDKFWHGHILDTVKYVQDCENVFGYFLHHYPYFGLRGEQDAANLAEAAVRMRRLYEQEFGNATSTAAGASYCCKAADPVAADAQEASAYCCKAADSVTAAATDESAYCCKAAVSYCCKASDSVAAQAQEEPAYCCKAAVSYCCKASDSIAAQAAAETAYCCKAADSATATDAHDMLAAGVSYCCKAADKVTEQTAA